MGCDNTKFRFPPGEEFADAYNKYCDLDENLQNMQRNQKNFTPSKDPFAALEALGENLPNLMENLGGSIKTKFERDQAFEHLKEIYERQKNSNTLGENASLKISKYNRILTRRENEEKAQMKQIKSLQKNMLNMQNMMGNLKIQ